MEGIERINESEWLDLTIQHDGFVKINGFELFHVGNGIYTLEWRMYYRQYFKGSLEAFKLELDKINSL